MGYDSGKMYLVCNAGLFTYVLACVVALRMWGVTIGDAADKDHVRVGMGLENVGQGFADAHLVAGGVVKLPMLRMICVFLSRSSFSLRSSFAGVSLLMSTLLCSTPMFLVMYPAFSKASR